MKFLGGFASETLANAHRLSVEWQFDDTFRRSSTEVFWFRLDQTNDFHATMNRLREVDHRTGVSDDFDPTPRAILGEKP